MRGRLVRERDVIAVDLPGFGDSPPLPAATPAGAAVLATEVARLCDELGLGRVHLAGNSLGAWVALELAKTGRAATVCGISPAGLWSRPLGPRRHDARRLALRLRPLLRIALRWPRLRAAALSRVVADPRKLSREQATALVLDSLDAPGYDAANHAMRTTVFERPELVCVPTTIARGDADRLVDPPQPQRLPPGARLVVLDGVGHTPTWDDPPRIAALLLEASAAAAADPAVARAGR